MSADNGIYILQTKDGFRVAHIQAVDNMWWHPTCCSNPERVETDQKDDGCYHERCENCGLLDPEFEEKDYVNWDVMRDFFGKSEVYPSQEVAMLMADEIYKEITSDDLCGIVEYGIQIINGLEGFDFPTKKENEDVN